MAEKTGQCMCGSVRFRASDVPSTAGVCHCEMCRRWTGSALIGVTVPSASLSWEGEDCIARIQSSSWAERAFCSKCGTGLYFRVTRESAYSDETEIPLGLFDEPNGFQITNEIYIDHKPESFAYAGTGRKTMTRQDCIEKFPVLDAD